MRLHALPVAAVLAAATFALHLVANPHYGVFRDELYFIACGLRPAVGYVDQPPLAPLIAAASYKLFGLALTPLRLAPALAMTATVALSADYAKRLGGGRFAQALAGLCVLFAPVLLVDGLLASTDMLQPLSWLAAAWLLARLAQGGDERLWLALGAVVGVSLWSKYLIAFYAVGLAAGLLATPLRRRLASPWPYAGAALALAIIAPNLVWQASQGWPFLEVAKAGAGGKNLVLSPLGFVGQQLLFMGPLTAPVWLAGLWGLARGRLTPAGPALALAYAVTALIFLFAHGKAYYLAPAYPALLAAGGVWWESVLRGAGARTAALALIAVGGLVSLPDVLPVLPPDAAIAYIRALGLSGASATERGAQAALPQHFADMFGWREMAGEVERVYRALPADERERAVFLGRNYGEAAAVELYSEVPAISGHNQYGLWGPGRFDGSVVIALARPGQSFPNFEHAEIAGRIDNSYAMPYETGLAVFVLRGIKGPLAQIWPELRHDD